MKNTVAQNTKRQKGQAPSCQEMEALEAETEQLKALVLAPPPSPTPHVVVWDLCEDGDDVMSTTPSNSPSPKLPFQRLSLSISVNAEAKDD